MDIALHIDETLDVTDLARLAIRLRTQDGVIWARTSERDPHLLRITYDPERITPQALHHHLKHVERVHARPADE